MSSNSLGKPKVITPLVADPVTLSEFKDYAHITYTDDDTALLSILKTAIDMCQQLAGKSFGEVVYQLAFSTSGRGINIPMGPIVSVDSVEYKFAGCCGETPSATYDDITADENTKWKFDVDRQRFFGDEGDYIIEYTTDDSLVTDKVKTAIKTQAKWLWDNRESDEQKMSYSPIAKNLLTDLIEGDRML
jgi:hypothetical protein